MLDSAHGFSQILISQTTIALNKPYTDNWQLDIREGNKYLEKRIALVFDLLKMAKIKELRFSGLATQVRVTSKEEDSALIARVADCFDMGLDTRSFNELDVKQVKVISKKFFSHIRIHNFRGWTLATNPDVRLPTKNADTRGIEVVGDFNDRYQYNENENYVTSLQAAKQILKLGLKEIDEFTETLIK